MNRRIVSGAEDPKSNGKMPLRATAIAAGSVLGKQREER